MSNFLATGTLTESDARRFEIDFGSTKISEFTAVKRVGGQDGLTTVGIHNTSELLPDVVARNMLVASLVDRGGELNRMGWGDVIQIV